MENVNSLTHFGILGMKWGIRRRGPASKDHTDTHEIRKKHVSELSNAELQKAVTRLQLEKQYKQLSTASIGKGQKWIQQILLNIGTQTINSYAKSKVDPGMVDAFKTVKENIKNKTQG